MSLNIELMVKDAGPGDQQLVASPITVTYCGMFTAALMHLIWKIEMTIIVLPRGVLGGSHESILHRMMPSTE